MSTGGPRLARFLGTGKKIALCEICTIIHSQFPLVQILLYSNSTCTNFTNKSEICISGNFTSGKRTSRGPQAL